MTQRRPLEVVFCWHMHQPQYRRADGTYEQPWTYLHALKDYSDMAWHLEENPAARAVVNLTPVLLEQLADYAQQFAARRFRDPILNALQDPARASDADRPRLVEACFRANATRMIDRYPAYRKLREFYDAAMAGGTPEYLSARFLGDVAVWYHLAWLGESIHRSDARAKRLREKGAAFDAADRAELLALMGEMIAGIVPRYRALAAKARIELSTSPYAHPILPLLLDFQVARESMPDAALPSAPRYPGGERRAIEHLRAAVDSHLQRFDTRPAGCWPSEGAVSRGAIKLIAQSGFAWTASCESVLTRSLQTGGLPLPSRTDFLYQPYRVDVGGDALTCFFRDVRLSDLIGFRYADWHADDAASDFANELTKIADDTAAHDAPIVSIILDGENAWEHYPENAYHFLSAMYRAVDADPRLHMTTFADYLSRHQPAATLAQLTAGSWVYGTLSTWIGDADKNRAWDLLAAAKTDFDNAVASGKLAGDDLVRAERQLKYCEGSDWFWWFGDYNPAQTVSDFDRLFRDHIRDLYALMHLPVPPAVDAVIGVGAGAPVHGGSMRENPPAESSRSGT